MQPVKAIWNHDLILSKKFPQKSKLADIASVYKKEDSTKVKNYRPVECFTYSINDLGTIDAKTYK